MLHLKKFFWAMVIGGLAGALVFAWFSPSMIAWYFSPPSDVISCKPAVEWAVVTYRKVMFTGVLLGAIAGGILFLAFFSRRRPGHGDGQGGAQAVPPSAQL